MRCVLLVLACLIGFSISPAKACTGPPSIMRSPLAIPDDFRLNMFDAGPAFVVSMPECGSPAYPQVFASNLADAKKGDAKAMDAVGLMYAAGAGVEQNWREARRWLEAAAAKGSGSAHYRLGMMAERGLGREIDLAVARSHYSTGSQAGIAFSSTNLAVMFLQGKGVSADFVEAMRLLELARSQGDHVATYNLAAIHAQDAPSQKADLAKAFAYADEAARAGNAPGMRLLGYFFANGKGVARDLNLAFVWASMAAQHGDPVGAELVKRLEARLTPEQLAEAGRRLDQCKKDDLKLCK